MIYNYLSGKVSQLLLNATNNLLKTRSLQGIVYVYNISQCFEKRVRNRPGRITGSTGSTRFSIYYILIFFYRVNPGFNLKNLKKRNPAGF